MSTKKDLEVKVIGGHGGVSPGYQATSYLINGELLIDAGSIASGVSIKEQLEVDNILEEEDNSDDENEEEELVFNKKDEEVEENSDDEVEKDDEQNNQENLEDESDDNDDDADVDIKKLRMLLRPVKHKIKEKS